MKRITNLRGKASLAITPMLLVLALSACGNGATNDNETPSYWDAMKSCDVDVIDDTHTLVEQARTGGGGASLETLGLSGNREVLNQSAKKLEKRKVLAENNKGDCNVATAASTDSSDSAPGDNGEATVRERNGDKRNVPVVTTAGGSPTADTRNDPMTPASIPVGVCDTLLDWSTLVDCVEDHDMSWYKRGVDQRAMYTGFDWDDIERWANAKNAVTAEVRAIEVYGRGISDAEARKRAVELVGKERAAELAIVRQPHCFNNTRGLEAGTMQDFVYCPPDSRKVRVSLLPAVMEKGKIVGIRDTDSGVFVDCINVWWIPPVVKVPGLPPQMPEKPDTPETPDVPDRPDTPDTPDVPDTPDTPETPVCPPGQHGKPPFCKDSPSDGPAHNPEFPEQQKPNQLPAPDQDYQPTRPPTPPPTYHTPAPAKPTQTLRPTQAPVPEPEPEAPEPTNPVDECIPSPGKSC